jgi:TfoX/Sxy family transcriptional regulator of competence genes
MMATSKEFIEFVCEQIAGVGFVRYRKMFGEYMVYVNDKPIFLVCDNQVYVKISPEVAHLFADAERGTPYDGAREHYLADADNGELLRAVAAILEPITPLPKPRKKS